MSAAAVLRRSLPLICSRCRRSYSGPDGDIFLPAALSKVDPVQNAPLVQAYFTNGFMISGARVMGSVALLPRGMLHWRVASKDDLTPESFSLFHLVEPKIDVVVLGTGSKVERVDPAIRSYLQRKGISLEIQDTPNACATFNFLLDEGRLAGAALIPPDYVPP
ncbi:NADH dehydrogenase [ubiquinone] 1 alpha subcomplex assembly factor 3 [Geodia barretti]|uniref:NADH dehydrogenase [ubiquinone] 1 alpha subcomplex assembly factor 3 n=1 Tax=Geodia barretti TaxID=519541 RepID=A0AA35X9B9_GEOBA|nr:NADH dehydrogenase [ubiquinone] 1 alpha subcomplex assembly factor 3 [Geodia barretti]